MFILHEVTNSDNNSFKMRFLRKLWISLFFDTRSYALITFWFNKIVILFLLIFHTMWICFMKSFNVVSHAFFRRSLIYTCRNIVSWCGFSIWKLTSNRIEFFWWEAVWCEFYCGFWMNLHKTHAKKDIYFIYSSTREKRYIEEKLILLNKLSNKLIMLLIMFLIMLLIMLLIMFLIMLLNMLLNMLSNMLSNMSSNMRWTCFEHTLNMRWTCFCSYL
jgi:ABC-type multidrug transport system fused ATPase/permease subunit